MTLCFNKIAYNFKVILVLQPDLTQRRNILKAAINCSLVILLILILLK